MSIILNRDTLIITGALSNIERARIDKMWNKAIKKGLLKLDFIKVGKSK